jgi:hypothetical protein
VTSSGTASAHALIAQHSLHAPERAWPESNCYLDVWIEVLRHWGHDPRAMLAPVFGMDWEGDQFTFVKTAHADVEVLYGIEVQELNVWQPLEQHAEEQLALGRIVLVEVNSHWLPDTSGTTYRAGHGKTTIGIHEIDRAARRLVYSHGPGTFVLDGDDYDGVLLRRPEQQIASFMPPFCEIAKPVRPALSGTALAAAARALLREQIRRRPAVNPLATYRAAFPSHLEKLFASPIEYFHLYAFATLRQVGADFALGADFLRWLASEGQGSYGAAITACEAMSEQARLLQLRLARASVSRRAPDAAPYLDAMVQGWDDVMTALVAETAIATN